MVRVAEIAFLTPALGDCAKFYRKLGLEYPKKPSKRYIHFADVGKQFFGFAHEERGFYDGHGKYIKVPLHVAFEVPGDRLDECRRFLVSLGIKCSPKIEASRGWHGAEASASIYFMDPAGNIMELWGPRRRIRKKSPKVR